MRTPVVGGGWFWRPSQVGEVLMDEVMMHIVQNAWFAWAATRLGGVVRRVEVRRRKRRGVMERMVVEWEVLVRG